MLFFVKVVVLGSFAEASRTLGVPKSTLSDKVAELERDLGVTLLTRTTRRLKLTDVGEEFFKKAEGAVSQLQEAELEAAQAQKTPTGTLRITAPAELLIIDIVMKAISEYRNKFPQVKMDLDFSDRYVDLVAEGYDLAIRGGELEDSSLMAKRVGLSKFILVASPGYLKNSFPVKMPKDLENHTSIRLVGNPMDDTWILKSKLGKTVRVKVPYGISSNSFSAIKSLATKRPRHCSSGMRSCQVEILEKKLVRILPEWATADAPLHIVYPPQRFSSPKVKEMVPLLEKRLKELTDAPS